MKPGLLLHHCCAPCSVRVISGVAEQFDVQSFWFNPNVQPQAENVKRRISLEGLVQKNGLQLYYGPEYPQDEWIEIAKALGPERCAFCYSLRLRETAKKARSLGLEYFSTSLLASPYQKHDLIKETGLSAAKEEGVKFHYADFRPFYYEGKAEAAKQGYYMQKYCGCLFSKEERERQKQAAKVKAV